jgi:hypothetical protein
MVLTPAPEIESLVTTTGGDVPLGSALITGATESGAFELRIDTAPGLQLFDPVEIAWRERKWQSMIGDQYLEALKVARELVQSSTTSDTWNQIDQLLRGR